MTTEDDKDKRGSLPEQLTGPLLVAGAGVSGEGIARLLVACAADVTVADANTVTGQALASKLGCAFIPLDEAVAQVDRYATVVTSPGWRPNSELFVQAAAHGVPVIGDVEVAWQLDQARCFGEPHTWVAITGTNGKTTTTGMAAAMLAGPDREHPLALAVGNIGVAVGEALYHEPRVDTLVAELSSFQLHYSSTLRPRVGIVLNLADDHLDWHGSFEAYAAAKAKVLHAETPLVNADDPVVRNLAPEAISFTLGEPAPGQIGVRDGYIVDRAFVDDNVGEQSDGKSQAEGEGLVIAPVEGISPPGVAGIADALAATAVARALGAPAHDIAAALASFSVASHRGAITHRGGGVTFVDNSKATNPHAAAMALKGVARYIWIGGGQLKGAHIDTFLRANAPHMTAAALLGVDREKLREGLANVVPELPVFVTGKTDKHRAMREIFEFVASVAQPGDTVMLAPAAASLDMYKGMAERGDIFTACAKEFFPSEESESAH
ncbi:UDP-N-acetylmuramoylalanine-D-glutamate ligase [Corynebacterium pyruviciproducens ATCC BAA-1742]|uniref:UDP-N-acetylmuramoylalanine--D-glutamate ligase n=1 Tax=Corynebacterium pyruviciproducens ATCC BAA-1742 TaxID=1125779 RepID=S2ZIV6_9CORY|nr:UDP-N-acetylmuramoyl-L-alanine--D-glutamate ligase [Corynebacterium pyruviciproducens]EPD70012.1 UDP-N-acetylmuramoylalanine-D-glutamate ligase [Corynebacterium pyruviciproducens ATCC BAA-1742]